MEGVMECRLVTSEEFQALRIRLLGEVKRLYKLQVLDHSPIYMRLICTKRQLIGDTLEFIYKNPHMMTTRIIRSNRRQNRFRRKSNRLYSKACRKGNDLSLHECL